MSHELTMSKYDLLKKIERHCSYCHIITEELCNRYEVEIDYLHKKRKHV